MYLAVELNSVASTQGGVQWGYVNRLGHAMVQETKIEIGGSKIDEQYGDWLNIWYELTHKVGQERGYARMIGDVAELKNFSSSKRAYQMYVPLQYWFNRNNGLALPLIALQYHDVRVTVQFRDLASCVNYVGAVAPNLGQLMGDSYLLIDYVYLDSEERKRFAQASHEYLIEQLQFTGSESLTAASNKYRLNFNHPSKYLIWVPHLERYVTRSNWIAYAQNGNWAATMDTFAKIVALASFDGLVFPGTGSECKFAVTGSDLTPGDLVSGTNVASGLLRALALKVEVKFVALSVNSGLVNIGATSTEAINNGIVTRNDLTMEDISATLEQLLVGAPSGTNSAAFLSSFAVAVVDHFNYGNFIDGSDNPVYNAKLQLNGHDRFQSRDGYYFNYVQPFQHFSNTPADGVNVYSFALKAEDHQPTGTCNFSRIDNATLQMDLGKYNYADNQYIASFLGSSANSVINIYTVNYNVLRVMSGMAGTAYSN
jgi:hypothetical protein